MEIEVEAAARRLLRALDEIGDRVAVDIADPGIVHGTTPRSSRDAA